MSPKTEIFCPEQLYHRSITIAKYRRSKGVEFLICNSCFWCTSLLSSDVRYARFDVCPCCKSYTIESMPIAPNDEYSFYNDEKTGVVLEFRYLKEEEEAKEGK